ncbi:hypothetical protein SDC9_135977 [bioreactor metagenome]|uniref:Uncharacterized protein n=1 Tax=bioreactor metagenome TaxID=1076179 RepID=A0A645DJ75_9ZZZZ
MPSPAMRSTSASRTASGTSPSNGQPKAVDNEALTCLRPSTSLTISANCANDCAGVIRRLAALCVSLADITRFSSSTPQSSARSAPRMLGTSAAYSTPGIRSIPRITASASASAGMALGEVNDVTSILASPVRLKPLIRSIFCSVGTKRDSIWNPSRTETSWMYSRWPLAFCMSCPSNHAIGAQSGELVGINAQGGQHFLRVRAELGADPFRAPGSRAQLGHDARKVDWCAVG